MILRICVFMLSVCTFLQGEEASHRELQFENEHVKVWKTVIMPHQPLKLRRHDCARVLVGLKGGTITKIEETGETFDIVVETGKAYWFEADPLNEFHGDINETDEPIEVMIVELKSLGNALQF